MFAGAMTALITPFRDGQVDFDTLDELIEFQIEGGIDGIVPVGTTGECPTLSHDEHKKVIERVVKTVAGQVPVIAGAGSNSTAEAIELTAFAKKIGADATLQVDPYYNKPFLPALQSDSRRCGFADYSVRHPWQMRRGDDGRYDCAIVGD